jgi:hypothetical protein
VTVVEPGLSGHLDKELNATRSRIRRSRHGRANSSIQKRLSSAPDMVRSAAPVPPGPPVTRRVLSRGMPAQGAYEGDRQDLNQVVGNRHPACLGAVAGRERHVARPSPVADEIQIGKTARCGPRSTTVGRVKRHREPRMRIQAPIGIGLVSSAEHSIRGRRDCRMR